MADSMDISTARGLILKAIDALSVRAGAVQTVPVAEATGHRLAESVVSPLDVPERDISAMDGYAIALKANEVAGVDGLDGSDGLDDGCSRQESGTYRLVGHSLAGHPFQGELDHGEAIEIATGGWLPVTATTVVPIENACREGETLKVAVPPRCGQHLRQRGETFHKGQEVLVKGTRLAWHHQAVLATLGIRHVAVVRPLRVAVLSSGDELSSVSRSGAEPSCAAESLTPGLDPQHFDTNRPLLMALLAEWGCDVSDAGVLPDNAATISHRLAALSQQVDVIVTSGGVSKGVRDDIRHAFERQAHGAVWQLNHKPGRAFLFGSLTQCLVFGLPGNPLAALACAVQLVLPALDTLAGRAGHRGWQQGRLASLATGRSGRNELLLGRHWQDEQGQLWLKPLSIQNSHRVDLLVQATCLIELDEGSDSKAPGEYLAYFPLDVAGVVS